MSERLTTRKMIDATLTVDRLTETSEPLRIADEVAQLYAKVKVFEAVVWFPRLQAQVNGSDARGMYATCRDIKVLTWCCAGRCLIQLERGDATLTLITADDEKPWVREMAQIAPNMGPMGIQGIDAEFMDALKMLYEVTRYGEEIVLQRNDDVTIGV